MIEDILSSIKHKKIDEFYELVLKCDVNTKDNFGYTILHIAISSGVDEAAIYYVENGGDVNAQDADGVTGLHYCAAYKNSNIAKLLADSGASFEIADKHGNEPLWTAMKACTRTDYSMLELYLIYTNRINIKNNYGISPLDSVMGMKVESLIKLIKSGSNDQC